jgi:hypothetical protein
MPAPAAPEKVVPTIMNEPGPAAEGTGRVVLDAQGERARVIEITGTASGVITNGYASAQVMSVATRPVCVTPCIADLSYGTHELVFTSQNDDEKGSNATVDVGAKPSIFRHTMGGRVTHPAAKIGGATAVTLGGIGALTGLSLFAAGALSDSATPADPTSTTATNSGDGVKSTGLMILGVSGAVLVAGVVLLILGRDEVQPGSSTQWIPGADAPVTKTRSNGENVLFRY